MCGTTLGVSHQKHFLHTSREKPKLCWVHCLARELWGLALVVAIILHGWSHEFVSEQLPVFHFLLTCLVTSNVPQSSIHKLAFAHAKYKNSKIMHRPKHVIISHVPPWEQPELWTQNIISYRSCTQNMWLIILKHMNRIITCYNIGA